MMATLKTVLELRDSNAAAAWGEPLSAAAKKWGIDTPLRQAHWLAQLAHESAGFALLQENLSYSAERIAQVWPNRFKSAADARPYARNPKALANNVYANRMGNGAPNSGDGWRYRGRGLIHLTGRSNYQAYQAATGVPVVEQPDLLLEPEYAADAAGWYWHQRGINRRADDDDLEAVTRAVNGGLNGLADRRNWLAHFKAAFDTAEDAFSVFVMHFPNRKEIVDEAPFVASIDGQRVNGRRLDVRWLEERE